MSLSTLLMRMRSRVEQELTAITPPYTLFFSLCDVKVRASVLHVTGEDAATVWQKGAIRAQELARKQHLECRWLRVDWVCSSEALSMDQLQERLQKTKRNYFRHGLALDSQFKIAFLEQELNGNAMLYGGSRIEHATINEKNFQIYAKRRHGQQTEIDFSEQKEVYILTTQGAFCGDGEGPLLLHPTGLNSGRRVLEPLSENSTTDLIHNSSHYLATQVRPSGQFIYGWHPCFDRSINTYNSLRHASSTYSMIEAWEVTGDDELKSAIDRALGFLTRELIRQATAPNGEEVAFLLDQNNEIKLGGNAVCLLALTKYTALTGTKKYDRLLEQLALGIRQMQDPISGRFVHVLQYPELSVKEEFRIIYYDGEAAFGLMRLYGLSRDPRWLEMVVKAFDHFIAAGHWKAHDHWLSYCVNELTLYRPEERYYQFGLQNVSGYLNFVLKRITTFPTLLELMMAAEQMVRRIQQQPELQHLMAQLDQERFYRALEYRAHYLLNGHFWPEYAMYFKNPARVLGSFFIRHHAFRVRIDDVEHYLSGFVAYLKYLKRTAPATKESTDNHQTVRARNPMKHTDSLLFAKVANFQIDAEKLKDHFLNHVSGLPSTPYRDNRVDYIGWAVTSRDGSLEDGVKRINAKGSGNKKRGVEKTPVCTGYIDDVMQALKDRGLSPYRARIMQLVSNGETMPFHRDAERETWRLHIPIITNESSYFEWRREDGSIESVHLPADGSAWLVRVDIEHRAVNLSTEHTDRVHLLMGLNKIPEWEMLSEPMILVNEQTEKETT